MSSPKYEYSKLRVSNFWVLNRAVGDADDDDVTVWCDED